MTLLNFILCDATQAAEPAVNGSTGGGLSQMVLMLVLMGVGF